jgi:hypothetical protein
MKKLSILVIALISIFGAESVKAWNNYNHGAAAYIAELHLTPEAKAKCHHYLKHTLPYYASWMDAFRGAKAFREVNRAHTGKSTADGKAYDFEQGKPAGGVMGYLVSALEELGDGKYKNLPDSVVRQRLINMSHYVPDMHCPVHIVFPASVHTSQKEMQLHDNGKPIKYHTFWDSYLGRDGRYRNWTYERVAAEIDTLSEEEIKAIQSGTLEDWGLDIIEMGHKAYELLPLGSDVSKLTKEQKEEMFKLVSKATLLGGYRLAHVLNTIFAE